MSLRKNKLSKANKELVLDKFRVLFRRFEDIKEELLLNMEGIPELYRKVLYREYGISEEQYNECFARFLAGRKSLILCWKKRLGIVEDIADLYAEHRPDYCKETGVRIISIAADMDHCLTVDFAHKLREEIDALIYLDEEDEALVIFRREILSGSFIRYPLKYYACIKDRLSSL
jgi:hypothetical protein